MTSGTHIAFASVLYLGGATLFGYKPDGIGWLLAAVASLGPDVDLPTSKIGRLFFWLSVPLERRFGHRTITHSVVGMLTVALIASPLWWVRPLYFWCVLGGTWSHVWIDMLNVRGADLFWPSPVRVVAPGNRNWRLEVGSKAEMILLSVLMLLTVALYPLSHLGFRDALQATLSTANAGCYSDWCANQRSGATSSRFTLQYGGTYSQAARNHHNYVWGYGTGRNTHYYSPYYPTGARIPPHGSLLPNRRTLTT